MKKIIIAIVAFFAGCVIVMGFIEGIMNTGKESNSIKPDSIITLCTIDTTNMEPYEKASIDLEADMVVKLIHNEYGCEIRSPYKGDKYIFIKYDRVVNDGRMPWDQSERKYSALSNSKHTLYEFEKRDMPYRDEAKILHCDIIYGRSVKKIPGSLETKVIEHSLSFDRDKDSTVISFIEYNLLREK